MENIEMPHLIRACGVVGLSQQEALQITRFANTHSKVVESNARLMQATYIGYTALPVLMVRAASAAYARHRANQHDESWQQPLNSRLA